MEKIVSVAVIGAGAAGLNALRLLNHSPSNAVTTFKATAFEQSKWIGGTWVYTDCIGTDDLGLPVHSSMYKNLRTNLPKECMAFPDYFFPSHLPSFVDHGDVQKYLEDYAAHFDLWKDIKLKTVVEHVKPVPSENNKFGVKWQVTTSEAENRENKQTELFDAVLVCNGHYSKPLIPNVLGLEVFEGHLIHSHVYREPSIYTDKTVLLLGAKASGQDIALEVAKVASRVYLSHRGPPFTTFLPEKIVQKPGIKRCNKKVVEFSDGSALEVDAIILCTGYLYDFHFLDDSIGIQVEDERVTHLYKHFLSVDFPSLGIVGIVKFVIPFPIFQHQILYFKSILEGTGTLLSKKEMLKDEEQHFNAMIAKNRPVRYAHTFFEDGQFRYLDELADLGNFNYLNPIVEKIYNVTHVFRKSNVSTYKNINFTLSNDNSGFEIVLPNKT